MPGGMNPPIEVVAAWPVGREHFESRGWGIGIVSIVLYILCIIVVALRLWSRLFLTATAGIDDLIIAIAMVCVAQSLCRLFP